MMTEVHTVICQIQAPSRVCPTGKCVEGCFVISEDNVLILTDRAGNAATDIDGRQYTHALGPNEDARTIARRLTKELRGALRGGDAPARASTGRSNISTAARFSRFFRAFHDCTRRVCPRMRSVLYSRRL